MKKKENENEEIEKIYVCTSNENDSNFIEKILIVYTDYHYDGYCIDSKYHKFHSKKQERLKQKMQSFLLSYLDDYHLDEKVIMYVTEKNQLLRKYIDEIFSLQYHKDLYYFECICILLNIPLSIASSMCLHRANHLFLSTDFLLEWRNFILQEFLFLINTNLSAIYTSHAIFNNHKRKLKYENHILKKLKLWFSYFILSFHIGNNIANVVINYEKFLRIPNAITLEMDMMTQHFNSSLKDNPFSDSIEISSHEKVDFLMQAFEENPYFTDSYMEAPYALKNYLNSNPYCDYEELYKIYSNLILVYDFQRDVIRGDHCVAADCDCDHGIIIMYEDNDLMVFHLEHELIHFTGFLDNLALNEGLTTLFQMEYINHDFIPNAYYDHVLLAKIFCELISPDKMLEAYSKQDMSIIEKEMLKINSNSNDYIELMNAMQEYAVDFKLGIENDFIQKHQNMSLLFYNLFYPYLVSDSLTEDQINTIIKYIQCLGEDKDCFCRNYFNYESSAKEKKLFLK